jgi:hypothetical protein
MQSESSFWSIIQNRHEWHFLLPHQTVAMKLAQARLKRPFRMTEFAFFAGRLCFYRFETVSIV